MSRATISQLFHSRARFVAVLVAAELSAAKAWEITLTNEVRELFERHDINAKLSAHQRRQLYQIAGE